jgi:hypothetical protein
MLTGAGRAADPGHGEMLTGARPNDFFDRADVLAAGRSDRLTDHALGLLRGNAGTRPRLLWRLLAGDSGAGLCGIGLSFRRLLGLCSGTKARNRDGKQCFSNLEFHD